MLAAEVARVPILVWGGKGADKIQPSDERFLLRFATTLLETLTAEEKVLANPELYDAPPVMTKELIADVTKKMRESRLRHQIKKPEPKRRKPPTRKR